MRDDATPETGPGTRPEVRLAEAWAGFAKARAIYPPTNERVLSKLDRLLEAIADTLAERRRGGAHDEERGATVLFHETSIVFDGNGELEFVPTSTLAWLRQRVAHAGLAGVEWMASASPDAVQAFTQRLLDNFLRKDPGLSFEDMWPERYEGIVLVDRRFEGTFGGADANGTFTGGHAGTDVEASQKRHFVMGILAHPKVARRVAALHGSLEPEDYADLATNGVRATDVLRRILDDVPAEALQSRDRLIDSVCGVLDRLRPEPPGAGAAPSAGATAALGPALSSAEFAQRLQQVSRTHFSRQGPELERLKVDESEAVEPSPAGGRPRDEDIVGDVESLVAELGELPAHLAYDLDAGDADSRPEQLAVFLHYLVHLQRPEELTGLYPTLDRLLDGADEEDLQVLRAHVQDESLDVGTLRRRRRAILAFLMRAGRSALLRHCGILTPAFVQEDVARRLPVYLASLDPASAADTTELNGLCAALGIRLFEHAEALQQRLPDLRREQAAAVLARPHAARLPLARLLLASHPGRLVPEAAAFLRALDLPEDESFLLYQLRNASHLRRTYLCGLMDLHLGRVGREIVQRAAVDVLCKYVRSTRDPLPAQPERLAAIKSLARYPCPSGAAVLAELSRTRFGPFGGAEPPSVRKLARSLAREFRGVTDDRPRPDVGLADLDAAVRMHAAAAGPGGGEADDERTQAA